MKRLRYVVCLALLVACLVFPSAALASNGRAPLLDDKVVIFGTFTLEEGEVLDGNLVVIGGVVNLEEGSRVKGDVVILGGNVTVEGVVESNLLAMGGVVTLSSTAIIHGDLIAPATVVRRDEKAKVYGQIITENVPLQATEVPNIEIPDIEIPEVPETPSQPLIWQQVSSALQPVVDFFGTLARSLLFSAVAVLVMVLLPEPSRRVEQAVQEYPMLAGGLGLLSMVLAVPVLITLTITIILIPATILVSILLALAVFFGWVAVSAEVGRRMAEIFKQEWTTALQVGIGAFSLSFFTGLLSLAFLDFLGALLWILVGAVGIGAVLLTRFGTRRYVSSERVQPAAQMIDTGAEEEALENEL